MVKVNNLEDFNRKTIEKNTPKIIKKRLQNALDMALRILNDETTIEGNSIVNLKKVII